MAVVLEALVQRGYSIAWRVLDAQYFGVPQRRRRVFIVGNLGNTGRSPEEILSIKQGRAGYLAQSIAQGKNTSRKTTDSVNAFGESSFGQFRADINSATLKSSGGVLGGGSETLLVHES
jgi:DNA (cytosine-5)-methyltransferase 1